MIDRQPAIIVTDVVMKFNLLQEKVTSLKEYFIKMVKGDLLYNEFLALKDVSFEVYRGESFGIIGDNGSGKSTLLKTISGIYAPTRGSVKVMGSISPLIELGAGFDAEMTARENIFLNGSILGYNERFINEHYHEIVEFSELKEFIDVPIKNFSSGMVARLGFAIATLVKPEILIVDEILAVGDYSFQKKCEEKMRELREGGTTLIFVSHSIEQVKEVCERVLWLNRGEIVRIGDSKEVCEEYISECNRTKRYE